MRARRRRGARSGATGAATSRRRAAWTTTAAAAAPANTPAEDAVPDLLGDELDRFAVTDRALLCLGDRQSDEEEWDADAVIEAGLDVEALTHPQRKAAQRDDGLTQRGVGWREDDREHERLRPREVAEKCDRDDESREQGERKPDSEKPRRKAQLGSQRAQVDPRGVREQHDGQRGLREDLDLDAGRGRVDQAERFDAEQRAPPP